VSLLSEQVWAIAYGDPELREARRRAFLAPMTPVFVDRLGGLVELRNDETLWGAARELAEAIWSDRIEANPSPETVGKAASWWVGEAGLTSAARAAEVTPSETEISDFYSYPANFAWFSRDHPSCRRDPTRGLYPDRAPDPHAQAGDEVLFAVQVGAQRLRFQGRYRDLYHFLRQGPIDTWDNDPMLLALMGLACLGQQERSLLAEGSSFVRHAHEHRHCHGRARHVCVEALCLAHDMPDQGAAILKLVDVMLANDAHDPHTYHRKAYGHLRRGEWDRALEALNLASANVGQHHGLDLLEDIRRTRREVVATRDIATDVVSIVTDQKRELEARAADLQRQLADSSRDQALRTVEVIGIFAAVLALILASTTIAANQTDLGNALLLIAALAITLLVFVPFLTWWLRLRRPNG
jgi:hypothetical protein